jgi:hypothetical protein
MKSVKWITCHVYAHVLDLLDESQIPYLIDHPYDKGKHQYHLSQS